MARQQVDFNIDEVKYYIYAVLEVDDGTFYVGKSRSMRPKKRLYDHLKGRIKQTKGHYGPKRMLEQPELIILESLVCTGAIAYKHMVAWAHYFTENGFIMLNASRVKWEQKYPFEEIKEIYFKHCAPYDIYEDVLGRWVSIGGKRADDNGIKMRNLNIRLSEDELRLFNAFCESEGLSQRKALEKLVLASNRNRFLDKLRRNEMETAALKEENAKLKREWVQEERAITRRYRQSLICIKAMLQRYVITEDPSVKKRIVYKKEVKERKLHKLYRFPEEAGTCELKIESLARGKDNRDPTFIFGETETGEKIKLRYYPKKEYVGQSPAVLGSAGGEAKMLTAYVPARDGAVDLIAGLVPWVTNQTSKQTITQPEQIKAKPSFDSIIADANSRRNNRYR